MMTSSCDLYLGPFGATVHGHREEDVEADQERRPTRPVEGGDTNQEKQIGVDHRNYRSMGVFVGLKSMKSELAKRGDQDAA
jgi:hypothetical protein